jgi:hypothetical protein
MTWPLANIEPKTYDGSGRVTGTQQVGTPEEGQYNLDWTLTDIGEAKVEFTQAIQELQTIPALQEDLEDDGQPPVPMVAGKETAMRVYFGEVAEEQEFTVEVTGEATGTETALVAPGCTHEERRAGQGGCLSTDFFFTPPAGNWEVGLVIRNSTGLVVLDEEFSFSSANTAGLTVLYQQICVRMTPGAEPTCPSNFVRTEARNLMRKIFPLADAELIYERLPAPNMVVEAPLMNDTDYALLLGRLRARYELMTMGDIAVDQVAGWLPGQASPGLAGISDPIWAGSTGRVSFQKDTSATDALDVQHTLAHEIGHNLGLRHTNLSDACNAVDGETDWPYLDSTVQEVGFDVGPRDVLPSDKLDLMTYCTPPGTNIWVSPHTFNRLIEGNFQPQGGGLGPAGEPGRFLVISGTAQADGSAATLDSAYVITSTEPAEASHLLGNYCLRVTGGSQVDYCFTLDFKTHQTQEPVASEAFTLRVPFPLGTARIELAGGGTPLASLEVSPSAPAIDITQPLGAWDGEQTLEWTSSDGDGDPLKFAVMYSPNGGAAWYPIAVDVTEGEFTFDTSTLDGDSILVRVLASDGLNTTTETTAPISLVRGDERLWGDNDCDGEISSRDNQALSRLVLQQNPLSQTQPCPALGASVDVSGVGDKAWGDLDCDGEVTSRDGQALLRNVLQQNALSQTQPCVPIGDAASVAGGPAALPARVRWWG